jgi:hypothetical protein
MPLREPGQWINITPLVTTSEVNDGQFLLSLDPRTPAVLLNKAHLYEIAAKDHHHVGGDNYGGDSWEHFGHALYLRNRSDNIYLGQ